MKVDFAREIALKISYEIEEKGAYSNIVLDEYLNNYREKLTLKDISLISELVYGVVTWKLTIDTILQKYSKTKLNKIAKWVLSILRIGIYQIVFLDKIPKSAAVNESVNLCKKYGFKSANFVNAILRKVEKNDYEELKNEENTVERISKIYSMPTWLVEKFLKEYDLKTVEEICQYSNEKPMLTIRVNSLKTNQQEMIQKLEERKISYQEGEVEGFIHLKNIKNVANLDLFKQGYFTIQDEGAGRIALILDPKPGENILDACSAPGGKTTQLAQLMKNQGEILAWDLYEHRIKLVEENAKRLEITNIKTKTQDALKIQEEFIEKFDKILLDVPCLGFGVIKRKPDIKWQRKQEDLSEITSIQLAILEICSKYLKVGGELVYSTCSILKEENEEIIEKWLAKTYVEQSRKGERFTNIYQELWLPTKTSDGFYINKIKRIK